MAMTERRGLCPHAVWALVGLLSLGGAFVQGDSRPVEQRMRKDVFFLASDECEGRGITTKGINLAADYIVEQFKKAGLKPAGTDGSYFQPFPVQGPGTLSQPNLLVLRGPKGQTLTLKIGEDFQVMGLSGTGKVTAPVVFAGYGITAPGIHYDDYAHLDAAGKVVIIIRKTPNFKDEKKPFDGDNKAHHAALVTKVINADLHKAAAVLFVNDRDLPRGQDRLMSFRYTAQGSSPTKLPAVHVRRSVVDTLLRTSLDTTLEVVEKKIDGNLTPLSAPLKGWTATLETTVKRQTFQAKNIVGYLEGSGPLARETVVVGAHYDHLGYGGAGSLAKNPNKREIHHGADDNGSGTTVLMEMARHFGAEKNRAGRRLVFIAFSGEESGLLGSDYYCTHPLFPLHETVAMVNLDMVGRLRPDPKTHQDRLEVHGTGTSPHFSEWLDALNKNYHFTLLKQAGGFGPSDHASFYFQKIPVYFFFTGNHRDYHRPSDTADKLNLPGMVRIASLVEDVLAKLTTVPERPKYVYVRSRVRVARGPSGPRLRFMPASYSEEDIENGVLIGDVIEDGPAARAGLKTGDRIVEIAGKPVKNLQGFMVLMRTQKKGQPVEVGFIRNGKKMKVKAVPE